MITVIIQKKVWYASSVYPLYTIACWQHARIIEIIESHAQDVQRVSKAGRSGILSDFIEFYDDFAERLPNLEAVSRPAWKAGSPRPELSDCWDGTGTPFKYYLWTSEGHQLEEGDYHAHPG